MSVDVHTKLCLKTDDSFGSQERLIYSAVVLSSLG